MSNANIKRRKPEWLRVKYNHNSIRHVSSLMNQLSLNTVCKEANCPNMGECYNKNTATFMILGSQCTRNCRFCNVVHDLPEEVDPMKPIHVAEAVEKLNLKHVVVTSVTRDDLEFGGAEQFVKVIEEVRKLCPDTTIEVLIPDLKGDRDSLDMIIDAKPDVLNHNVETVKSLYDTVRPEADYKRSLFVLDYVKNKDPHMLTKTGFMVGLGEKDDEVYELMDDILQTGCDILTVGQYLQPSSKHIDLVEYITPEKFDIYKTEALNKGFKFVASSPLVRSSYNAAEALDIRKKEESTI